MGAAFPGAAGRRRGWLVLLVPLALLLSSCGLHVAERLMCGDRVVVTVYSTGGMGIGIHEYHPQNLPSWARNLRVDGQAAHVETMQHWAGRDGQGNPTSGRELQVYELDRKASVLKVASSEMSDSNFNPQPPWEEHLECKPFSEFEVFMLYASFFFGSLYDHYLG